MEIIIKNMETDAEIEGKAFVHYTAWQEAYAGIVDAGYLARMTLEKCVDAAYRWRENVIVALDRGRVIGFAGYGQSRDEDLPDTGEVFAIYILSAYYGKGVGHRLMDEALRRLPFPRASVWVLRGNARAIAFYKKCGFDFDGVTKTLMLGENVDVVRMVLSKPQ